MKRYLEIEMSGEGHKKGKRVGGWLGGEVVGCDGEVH